jgi:hypothetical protein
MPYGADEHRSDIGSPDAAAGINVRAMESHGPFGQMLFFFCGYGGRRIAQLSRRGPGRRRARAAPPRAQSWATNMTTPPSAKFGTSAAAAWLSGEFSAAFSASSDSQASSARR